MQKSQKFKAALFLLLSVASIDTHAGRIASKCVLDEKTGEITGQNVETKLPLASVSKLFTSLFAVAKKGVNSHYITRFYVMPAGSDTYDVHLKGDFDPYFSEASLHYLISQLNKLKVYKIRNLTFDENFKFYFNVNGRQIIPGRGSFNPVDSQRRVTDPSPELIKMILSNKKQWLVNYNKTYARYSDEMVKSPKLAVASIDYLPKAKFEVASRKETGYIRSADMTEQLKMLNWNSNNHAANTIFHSLGGKASFDKFAYEHMKFKPTEIEFFNGSGNNENFTGEGRGIYNSASCSATVRVLRALRKSLVAQKHDFSDVVAVVGADRGATVQRYASNVGINDGVMAKSGTITPYVTLAGMINSAKGPKYFHISIATSPLPKMKRPTSARVNAAMRAEWSRSRNLIGAELRKMVSAYGGAKSIGYKARPFVLESFEDDENFELSSLEMEKQLIALQDDSGLDDSALDDLKQDILDGEQLAAEGITLPNMM